MDTPSVPGNGSGNVSKHASRAAGTAQKTAGGAKDAAAGAAEGTAQGVRQGTAKVGGQVAALPGKVAGLARLVTLGRLLRAAPLAAAAVAGVVVGRATARKR